MCWSKLWLNQQEGKNLCRISPRSRAVVYEYHNSKIINAGAKYRCNLHGTHEQPEGQTTLNALIVFGVHYW